MFIEFQFANFRSFRDLQRFSMVAAPPRSGEPGMDEEAVFETGGLRLLKSKAIYGPNAGGKSNLTDALANFHAMVTQSVSNEHTAASVWTERFGLLTGWDDEPMFFQLAFLHEGSIYRYGFQMKDGVVDAEWLFGRLHKQEVKLFTRGPGGIDISDVNFKGAKAYVELSLTEGHEIFRPTSLFLTGAALMGNKIALAIRKTIGRVMLVDGLEDAMNTQVSMSWLANGEAEQQQAIRRLLEAADPSIKDVQLLDMPEDRLAMLPSSVQEMFRERAGNIAKTVFTFREQYTTDGAQAGLIATPFATWESAGTRKLFGLSAPMLTALTAGRPFVIDEFDARFHPLITEKIVALFHNPETNPRHAQLLFVTHDASLLTRAGLRRDQICLVDKDQYGISTARTLIEFKGVRKDAIYEREYLQGTYGAVPYLGEFDQIVASLVNAEKEATTDGLPTAQ